MKKTAFAIAAAFACALCLTTSNAHACLPDHTGMWASPVCEKPVTKRKTRTTRKVQRAARYEADPISRMVPYQISTRYNAGPKPRKWCGWWMRTQFGGGPEYNRAWAWSKRGVASYPHVGAIVVWRNHVGYIVGMNAKGQWLVKSGNDGNAVRIRPRSLKGAVIRALV